jgi:translocation protein SEC62
MSVQKKVSTYSIQPSSQANPWAHVDKEVLLNADFLQASKTKLKVQEGILGGSRLNFFKGKAAINALMRDAYAEHFKRAPLEIKSDAEKILAAFLAAHLIATVNVGGAGAKRQLQVNQADMEFGPDKYYVWVYQGSQTMNRIMGIGIVVIIFIGCLFPLWPLWMRTGVYYLSLALMGVMGLFFGLAIVRLILWFTLKLTTGRGGWLYPNLFADCGVIESFYPYWRYILRGLIVFLVGMKHQCQRRRRRNSGRIELYYLPLYCVQLILFKFKFSNESCLSLLFFKSSLLVSFDAIRCNKDSDRNTKRSSIPSVTQIQNSTKMKTTSILLTSLAAVAYATDIECEDSPKSTYNQVF